jgi:hypothetical protein
MNRILLAVTDLKKNQYFICVLLLILSPMLSYGQGADTYGFSASTRSYSALTGTTDTSLLATDDDAISSVINLPFSFTFSATAYSQIKVSSNGWITFGTTTSNFNGNNSTNASGAKPILFPLWDDLQNSVVPRYVVTGTAPNRIFKVEWAQQEWDYSSNSNDISFQIWLYETTNVIEYFYNRGSGNLRNPSASIGIYDTNDKYLTLSNSTASPTAQSSTFTTNISTKPQNGQVYTWTPPCTLPTIYAMTGIGGSFCSNVTGSSIGLANSQTGVSYQLLRGSVAVGSPISGTGSALSFGTFNTTGTYTVLATRIIGSCTSTMSGSVSILSYSSPPVPTATTVNVSCPSDATGTITVTNAAAPASLAFLSANNQYIDFGAKLLSNRAAFTVEGWIKFDPANYINRMSLFGQNDVIEIAFEGNSLRCWTYNGGSVDLPLSSFPAGNAWHHIAVTGDGTTGGLKIYLDGGAPVTGGNATANYGSDTNYTTKIGYGIMDPTGIGLTGEVFKLGFWNRALTAAEITNMSSGFVVYDASQSGLLAGYSFNEGLGTTVTGVGSVASTGTFFNSPVWTDPYVYSWASTPVGFTSNLKNITGLTPRTYNLITSLKGCTNSGSWAINSTNPAPTITTTGIVAAVCISTSSQPATLPYTATTNSPTSYSIDWNAMANAVGLVDQGNTAFVFSAGGGNLNTILVPANTPSNSYSGIMTITTASGCITTQAITITVNAKPTVTFTAQPGAAACTNTDVVYSTQSGQSNYVWVIPGVLGTDYSITSGGTGVDNTVTLKWLTVGTKTVTVNYRNASGCSANAPTSSTATLVNPTPSAPVLSDIVLTCDQTSVTANWAAVANASDYKIDVSYSAAFGTYIPGYQDFSVGSTSSVTLVGLTPGATYYVRARAVNSCGTSSVNSNVATFSVKRTFYNGSSWSIAPNASLKAVFTGDATITTPLDACSCEINSGVKVVVGVPGALNDTAVMKLENGLDIVGTGTLTFENNASLIQVNDANNINSGAIIYKRNTKAMKNFDYTYWSSPVVGQTLYSLSPNTLSDKYLSFSMNKWIVEPGTNVMNVGKGYIIRVPKPHFWPDPTASTYVQSAEFNGTPNNGAYTLPIAPVGYSNLIGNPYPSAMSADEFLLENSVNNNRIQGTIRFWTHNTVINSSSKYSATDYASYNRLGGVGTMAAPSAGTGGVNSDIPSGYIAAGQSFMTISASGAGPVVFNNSMRVSLAGKNFQFFKGIKSKAVALEKHRIWLNLANSEGAFKQMLVGYTTGATNGFDMAFDGVSSDSNKYVDFYSVNDNKNYVIQGRALPFDKTDKVPLGYKTSIEGTFTISIDKIDGVLANQTVFIEDKATNVVHNLKNGTYTFSTSIGTFNDRFVLCYKDNSVVDPIVIDPIVKDPVVTNPIATDPIVTNPIVTEPVVKDPVVTNPIVTDPIVTNPIVTDPVIKDPIVTNPIVTDPIVLDPSNGGGTLGNDDFVNKGRSVVVSVKDHQIKINSFDETIGMVMVYDLRGRLLFQNDHVNKNEYVIQNLDSSDQFLIVLTQLINGKWVTKEIVF